MGCKITPEISELQATLKALESALDLLPPDKKGSSTQNQSVKNCAKSVIEALGKVKNKEEVKALSNQIKRIDIKVNNIAIKGGFVRLFFQSDAQKFSEDAVNSCKALIGIDVHETFEEFQRSLKALPRDKKGLPGQNRKVQQCAKAAIQAASQCSPKDDIELISKSYSLISDIDKKGGFRRLSIFGSRTKKLAKDAISAVSNAFKAICETLTDRYDFVQACQIAEHIPDKEIRENLLIGIKPKLMLLNDAVYLGSSEQERIDSLSEWLRISKDDAKRILSERESIKTVAHLNNIESTKHIKYEGFRFDIWPNKIIHRLENLHNKLDRAITQDHKEKLTKAFEHASRFTQTPIGESTFKKIATSINAGELVILPAGSRNHAIAMVFYKGYVTFCNGGPRINQENTLESLNLMGAPISAEDIRDIYKTTHETTWVQAKGFYRQFILNQTYKDSTERRNQVTQAINKLSPPEQTVGNCTEASMKYATIAAFALLRITDDFEHGLLPGYSTENIAKSSKWFAMEFFNYFSLSELEEYLKNHSDPKTPIDSYLVSECCRNIERMKEEALSPYWSHPINLDDFPHVAHMYNLHLLPSNLRP